MFETEGKTMKKILFATTALIATASMAAAEVKISGYGRFGLDYNDGNDRIVANQGPGGSGLLTSSTNITSRLRLQFDMSTETDGGVTLGARARVNYDSRDNVPGTGIFNGARFYATAGASPWVLVTSSALWKVHRACIWKPVPLASASTAQASTAS